MAASSHPQIARAVALALLASAATAAPPATQLPVPCLAHSCGANASAWVSSGSAALVQQGNRETINQSSANATLNWSSFNISSNGTVTFVQPTTASVALNQIFQGDPSKILGALSANGTIYLINQNGILFGPGAQVNVGSLLATSLNITPQAQSGLLQAAQQAAPALASFVDANGNPLPSGPVEVQSGANVQAPNGQVMMFAPQVTNQGTISANGGQVILAAGNSVYLAPSTDPNLRGLLVEVGQGGTVTNAAAPAAGAAPGQIMANDGNVTLAGLIVNQMGRISATTSVQANGSIYLLAQDGGSAQPGINSATLTASNAGTLTLGPDSETQVLLDSSSVTAVDATAQPRSTVTLAGQQVVLQSGANITAPSGNVSIAAQATPGEEPTSFSPTAGPGRLVIDPGVTIDVAGDNIQLPMQSNVIPVQLRGDELADSPLQQNGPLRGATVYIDTRQSGTLPDGTTWVGSPIGDLSGYVSDVGKTAGQRNLTGGTISLVSDGAAFVAPGSTLNVSGGSIQYITGPLNTTEVLGTNGQVYNISQALPSQSYVGIVSGYSVTDPKWGVTQSFPGFSTIEPGYLQGYDAGAVSVAAPALVLDGNLVGTTVAGPFQRSLPGAIPSGSLYRPIDQLPLPATLVLGVSPSGESLSNFLLPNVDFAPGTVFNQLTGPSGQPFNPLTDPLPDLLDTVHLRPDIFGADSFGFLQLYANGTVSMPADVSLQLPAGGGLAITAGAIDLEGSVRAASGSVALTATPTVAIAQGSPLATLTLGPHASLNVSGQWDNDLLDAMQGTPLAPLAINGGSVSIAAQGGALLQLESGSVIDVSGGAELTTAGAVTAGAGGSVSLGVAPSENLTPVPVTVDSTLRGFAIADGGSLSITANSICIAAGNCATGQVGTLWVAPALFAADGFSSVKLDSNLGSLGVAAGTTVTAQQLNYQLSESPEPVPTGTPLASFAAPALLPVFSRAPMSVTLATSPVGPEGQPLLPFDQTLFNIAGILDVGAGAVLSVDPGGSLTLSSSTSIVDGGWLLAPGGNVSVGITTRLPITEFLANQGIWIEHGALLSTRGTAIVQTNDEGLETGSVLPGGSISVSADRGFLYAAPGSTLDASGSAAVLDINPVGANGLLAATSTRIASAGGPISLAAADGLLLNGTLLSQGGGPNAAGGALSIRLDGNLYGGEPLGGGAPLLPLNPAQLLVGNAAPIIVAPETDLPESYTAVGIVPTNMIQQGGFSSLALYAMNLFDILSAQGSSAPASTGSIVFTRNTSLALPASLRLDAPQISVASGSTVSLTSAYVALGYDDTQAGAQTGDTVTPGTGTLRINGDLVDFIGSLGLSGVSTTDVTSSGDVRFLGIESAASGSIQPLVGTLQTQGTLTFEASQLYPTTLSQFSVVVSGTDSTLRILPGGSGATVLSAGGQLTLEANSIDQDGVLRAPFGGIALEATSLSLGAGSLTSVSGAGETIPFGSTQAGADWVYSMPLGSTVVYTQSGPPTKSIVLQANDLEIEKGATIDVSGGGDMVASEFVPGTGGTVDVLANAYNPAEFAIVPQLALGGFAPYDPQSQVGFQYPVGSSVVLGGGGSVPAGEYAILPARYALLPGAYLVVPVTGFTNIVPGTAFEEADGSTVVAGRFALAGTNLMSAQTQGFDLVSTNIVQTEAQYNLTSANAFFPPLAVGAGPNGTNAPVPQLPRDAGDLQLIAGQQLQFLGTLAASAGTGGRGAQVDISATDLEVAAGSGGTALQPGAVVLSAAQLNALGAQSLLIGGTRENIAGVEQITTTATDVTVDPNAQLSGSELLLTASDSLDISNGALLTATGAAVIAPMSYNLTGSGAFLRVSTGPQTPVMRTNPADASGGNLTIGPGATLQSTSSVTLEASGNLVSQAVYDVPGGSLSFTAPQISLGSGVTSTSGLALSPAALTALDLTDLSLTSTSVIDVYGTNTLKVLGQLSLQSGAIEAAGPDAAIVFEAPQVLLGSNTSAPALTPTSSTGTATLQADQLTLTGGTTAFAGFSGVSLNGASGVSLMGAGAITSDSPLTVHSAAITANPGVDFQLTSGGALQLLGAATAPKSPAPVAGAGGELVVTGSSVLVDTSVQLPAGVLELAATGPAPSDGVTLGGAAALDLAGPSVTFDTLQVAGNGGRLIASSAAGDISVAAGAVIDLSAGGPNADGGELMLTAPNGAVSLLGTLRAAASTPANGGQFSLDAQTLPALGPLSGLLEAGGFTGSVTLRQQGAGDLTLPASATLTAGDVTITGAGSVDILGTIDASGVSGGSVLLAAQNTIDVEGTIRANASGAAQAGGNVQLWSESGDIDINTPAVLNLSGGNGGAGGTLSLRVPTTSLTALVNGAGGPPPVQLSGTITGSSQVVAEGVSIYVEQGNTVLTQSQMSATSSNPIYANAATFTQSAPAISVALADSSNLNVSVVPGIEIQSTGDLTIPTAWDLSQWRFGTTAGILTLRAAGNLIVEGSLSDGFNGATTMVLPTTPGPSWSYRLVAGADLTASDVMDVLPLSAVPGSGNLEIAGGQVDTINSAPQPVMIRTGTGAIDIAAAGDLTFGNRASVIYTAGENSGVGIPLSGLGNLAYPTNGGNISISVGGDIIGAPTNQLVTSWLWRIGAVSGARTAATGWTDNYAWFEESVGALAGGNVTISAGGSIRELSVAIPTIGVQVGGTTAAQSEVVVTGGGNLNVEAGSDITGGSYFVGQGAGSLVAWDSIGPDESGASYATGIAPIVALGAASMTVTARGDLQLEGAVNPFLLPQGRAQPVTQTTASAFSTYGDSSAVTLLSAGGDVTLLNDETREGGLMSELASIPFTSIAEQETFLVYPSTVNVAALSGNVFVDGPAMALWPSHTGNVNLLAEESVEFAPGESFYMPDIDPGTLPNPNAPQHNIGLVMPTLFEPPPPGIGRIPVHSAQFGTSTQGSQPSAFSGAGASTDLIGEEDPQPARIVALAGDIDDANLQYIPKPIHLIAGQDIVGLWVQAENLSSTDLTEISAGQNLIYTFPRDPFGNIISDSDLGVLVEGPGLVLVSAGHSINLGTSSGITTSGNLYNPSLPAEGADVSVLAGATVANADISALVSRYLVSDDTYDSLLISFVAERSGTPILTKTQALQVFATLPPAEQYELCEQIMNDEIDAGGRAAAGPGPEHGNYTPSFLALNTLFPGSTSADASTMYPGSLSLYFSRVYTLDGGSISLTVPGGSVNVGISTPPASFGLNKAPSELGIVVQGTGNVSSVSDGDFEVNESRVFAADGGNILVWSTDGNVDAGRGAKTAISAPAPTLSFDQNGHLVTTFPAALTGSGIQALSTTEGVSPGNVDLFAPQGVVNANDAGIVAGNLTIGATAVLGRDNITVSGVAIGVPVETTGLGASLAGSSSVAGSASSAAGMAANPTGNEQQTAPVAANALGWLDVFILGFGEEQCKAEDVECLKRQQKQK